jgi:hypothetical protein
MAFPGEGLAIVGGATGAIVVEETEKALVKYGEREGELLAQTLRRRGREFLESDTYKRFVDEVKQAIKDRLIMMGRDTINDGLAAFDHWWATRGERRNARRAKRFKRLHNSAGNSRRFFGRKRNAALTDIITSTATGSPNHRIKNAAVLNEQPPALVDYNPPASVTVKHVPEKRMRLNDNTIVHMPSKTVISAPVSKRPRTNSTVLQRPVKIRKTNMVAQGAKEAAELHYKDGTVALKAYKNNTPGDGFLLLNAITQGNGDTQRIGNSVHIAKIHLQLRITPKQISTGVETSSHTEPMKVRVAVVWDKYPNGVQAVDTDIYAPLTGTDIDSNCFNNVHTRKRFRVIMSRTFVFQPQAAGFGTSATAAGESEVFAMPRSYNAHRTLKPKPEHYIDSYVSTYTAGTGAIGEITNGALYLVVTGDGSDGTDHFADVTGGYRIRFHE